MKNILCYLFLLNTLLIHGQKIRTFGTVTYQFNLSLGFPAHNTGTLYFSDQKSCYIESAYTLNHDADTKIIKHNINKENEQIKYFVDNYSKTLHKKETLDSRTYLISEIQPKIQWDISYKEQDTILDQLCYKAIGQFREW